MGRYAYRVETLGPYRINPLEHRGLAVSVARRFLRPGLDLDDLVQEALTALCVAARNYDPSKGASFATWSSSLMTNHLRGVVRSDTRMGSFGGRWGQYRLPQCRSPVPPSRRHRPVCGGTAGDVPGSPSQQRTQRL